MTTAEFQKFPKIARFSREVIVTEKIDGTNAQVVVWDESHMHEEPPNDVPWLVSIGNVHIAAASRTRYITPDSDNYGFAKWVLTHADELAGLRHGRHYGEWWGHGIQRSYGMPGGDKRLSLFNTVRWCCFCDEPQRIPTGDPRLEKWQDILPSCVGLVPIIWRGNITDLSIETIANSLRSCGSLAAPGFTDPEGFVVFHTAANTAFKYTLKNDGVPKSKG